MDFRVLWKLLVLLTTAQADRHIQSCGPIPKPFRLFRTAVIAPEQQLGIPNNSRSVIYQMQREPCLQLEYIGLKLDAASRVTIYGTCNFERMFRFTTIFVPAYNCWQSWIGVWNGENCETNVLTNDYLLAQYEEKSRIWESFSEQIDLVEGVQATDHLGMECMCNSTRNMVDFWRNKCRDEMQNVDNNWELEPRFVVEFVCMILGMYLLGGTIVCLVSPKDTENVDTGSDLITGRAIPVQD